MEALPRPQGRKSTVILATALAVAASVATTGCDNAAALNPTQVDDASGALRGVVSRYIADRDDGTSETLTFLRRPDGSELRLFFDRLPADPGLVPETPVSVWGEAAGAGIMVSRFRADPSSAADLETQRSALVGAAAAAPRKFAFVLVDTGAGVNLTAAAATQQLFDPAFFMLNQGSIRRYYQEESYAIQDITGAVVGPIAYTPTSTCDTNGVTSLRTMVDTMLGGASNHYLWYFGSKQSGCSFAGLASEGSPTRPQRDTWYNASSGCVVLVQEPGHNFGMQHSSSMACPGASFVDAPDGTCTHNEYGDPFDPMGSGCRHMNGWQKAFEGWLAGCNSVKVTSTGTFTLFPLESACNGIQLLQVPMPKTRTFSHSGGGGTPSTDTLTSYYVELRSPVGFDQGLTPMVLIHVAGDYPVRTKSGLHTWLLDMTPNTTSVRDAALAVGSTFTDPAGGVSITVMAASATQASIQVTVDNGTGAPTCLDGTTIEAPGPTTCGAAADGGVVTTGTGGAGGTGAVDAGGTGAGGATSGTGGASGTPDASIAINVPGKGATGANVVGGCACTTAPGSPTPLWTLAGVAAGIALALARRRRGAAAHRRRDRAYVSFRRR
jgi:hypothetical protein